MGTQGTPAIRARRNGRGSRSTTPPRRRAENELRPGRSAATIRLPRFSRDRIRWAASDDTTCGNFMGKRRSKRASLAAGSGRSKLYGAITEAVATPLRPQQIAQGEEGADVRRRIEDRPVRERRPVPLRIPGAAGQRAHRERRDDGAGRARRGARGCSAAPGATAPPGATGPTRCPSRRVTSRSRRTGRHALSLEARGRGSSDIRRPPTRTPCPTAAGSRRRTRSGPVR